MAAAGNWMNRAWPPLELTEDERRYVGHYAELDENGRPLRPGVLRRVYPVQLVKTLFSGESDQLQVRFLSSGRRTKVFACTFSGDLEFWQIRMSLLSGELLFQDYARVSALLNLAADDTAGYSPPVATTQGATLFIRQNAGPFCFEPHVVLEGSQAVVVDGQCDATIVAGAGQRSVLNIAFHVWEFPDAPRMIPGEGREGGGRPRNGESPAAGKKGGRAR